MPSVDGVALSESDWLARHKQVLMGFADSIRVCIDNSEWEKLSLMLESRRAYLERLLTGTIPEKCFDEIRRIAESIIAQDQFFKADVEKQKNASLELQLTLERGRRAVQRYNES